MVQLNAVGRDAAEEAGGVHSVTDVTGFGLAGHAFEMAEGSQVTLAIDLSALPLLRDVETLVQRRHLTRASATNREYVSPGLQTEGTLDPIRLEVFYDEQT